MPISARQGRASPLKAEIVNRIDDIPREKRLTQAAAARLMGIGQPDVSKMPCGLFRGFSLERLLVFPAALRQDVTIDVRPRPRGKAGSIKA